MSSTDVSTTDPFNTDAELDAGALTARYRTEGERIARIVRRCGKAEAQAWARRTAAIYRSSVLNPQHFAHAGEHRRQFVRAYLELKHFARDG
jgi:hypothetical protein